MHAQFLANKGSHSGVSQRPYRGRPAPSLKPLDARGGPERRDRGHGELQATGPKKRGVPATRDWSSQLEDFIRDESSHVEETDRILRDWPL